MSLLNICQGCLSPDRKLAPIGKHAKLYQELLLNNPSGSTRILLLFCWECRKTMDNILAFRLRVTRAQKILDSKLLCVVVVRIRQICKSSFNEDDICSAKALLFQTLGKIDQMPSRRRDGEVKNLQDIIKLFRETDPDGVPPFGAKRLDRVKQDSLSTLTLMTKVNEYDLTIQEDVKEKPMEIQVEVKHEQPECPEYWEETVDNTEVIVDSTDKIDLRDILKEEIVKCEDDTHFDDIEIYDTDVKQECDEVLVPLDLLEKKGNITVKQERKKRGVLKKKYITIIMEDIPDKRKLYDKVKIDQKGLEGWLEKKKKQTSTKLFQCARCYCGFSQQKFYDRHLEVRHAKRLGRYECDICGFRFPDRQKLSCHVRAHFVQFTCKLCAQSFCTRGEIYLHFAHGPHGRMRQCKECGLRFDCRRRREFFDHYRTMHDQFECDECGKKYLKKKTLIRHIGRRHSDHRCKICNTSYATLDSYLRHHKRKHVVEAPEYNYCVECNMQFINRTQYGEHLKTSVRHRANPEIPCPECGKIYTKRVNMTNHYDLVHLKKSKYHCALCDTYYLNGYRLRYHVKFFHEKRPKPKNKLCKYCGKGFSNNRILDNHVRTHTGERPFACAHCAAAFAQKQALAAHARAAHK